MPRFWPPVLSARYVLLGPSPARSRMPWAWLLVLGFLAAACGDDGRTGPERTDTIAPGAVRSLVVERVADDSVILRWAAPGDDEYAGRASQYEVRANDAVLNEARWENATPLSGAPSPSMSGITERLEVGGVRRGRWYFALKAADEQLNWSDISNVAFAELGDTIYPSAVTDLAVYAFDASSVTLTWTAPGDDGTLGRAAYYDVRYEIGGFPHYWWDATWFESRPLPAEPGTRELVKVDGLLPSVPYHFAIRAVDNGGNMGDVSNVVFAPTYSDTIPPARVTDFELTFAAGRSANFRWTAPGDNRAQGQAAEYDLRFSEAPITAENWDEASPATGLPAPTSSGAEETCTAQGLELDTTYHFALRTVDEAGNWSALSNEATATTASLIILPIPTGLSFVQTPDWEPNGDRIAFAAVTERTQIHLVSAYGGHSVQLTNHPESVLSPRWAPNGSVLAVVVFRSFFPYSHPGIGLVEPEVGVDPITISPHGFNQGVGFPSWSPDGTRIAYSASSGPNMPAAILVVDVSGGEPDTLLSNGSRIFGLDWSPSGEEIVFSSNAAGAGFNLYVIPVAGRSMTQLTNTPSNETQPRWSPDGSKIVFVSDRDVTSDIWSVPAGGGEWTPITLGPFDAAAPSWSPDGDAITFILTQGETQELAIKYLP